jgi:hypothetical protein
MLTRLERAVDDDLWPELLAEIPSYLEAVERGQARQVVAAADFTSTNAVLARGSAIREELGQLVPALVGLIAEERAHASSVDELHWIVLSAFDIANALECAGCSVPPEVTAGMGEWLPRVKHTEEDVKYRWKTGFIALALDVRAAYYPIAGYNLDGAIPFTAGQTFELNLQGLLGHLAGAVESDATVGDVLPAWQDLLRVFFTMLPARMIDPGTLLWIGRIVHHRIGGRPLGEVADEVRADLRRAVGLDT